MSRTAMWVVLSVALVGGAVSTAAEDRDETAVTAVVREAAEDGGHQRDVLAKLIDDLLWYQRVGDVAEAVAFLAGAVE